MRRDCPKANIVEKTEGVDYFLHGYPYKTLVPVAEDLRRRLTTLPKPD